MMYATPQKPPRERRMELLAKKAAALPPVRSEPLLGRLQDLLSQWRETATLYASHPDMADAASGYRECIRELEQIISGDLSPIEPMRPNTTPHRPIRENPHG